MVSIEEIERLVDEERFRDARAALDTLRSDETSLGWRAALRRLRLEQGDASVAVDETLLALDALAVDPRRVSDEAPLVHALRIRGLGIKRTFSLTRAAIARAHDEVGAHPAVLVEEGRAMLGFDERARARECFLAAMESDDRHGAAARYSHADLLYVLGDFDGALAASEALNEGPLHVAALRLRASCHAARQDHESEARCWAEVLAQRPDGDRAQADRVAYGLALASSGERRHALEQLQMAWRQDPASGQGRYARARIEHLERHLEGGRERRLAAFPTTAQKWNYCGPAVLELCLRFLDIELTQDEIADVVKRSNGTPMYEIAEFLRSHDIVARRIEATRERLTAAIDLGLPVIVQEEYSTTSHVAVITGYDEALGTFVAHDPATHRPMLKSFEFTERAGDLYGNGAVVVLGRAGPLLDELARRCDEAGLVEAPHLSILDDADRLRPSAAGADREEATLSEVLRRCTEAIAIAPRFKLAWHRRVGARSRIAYATGRPADRDAFLADLLRVRASFGEDEWPHQQHAYWLMDEGRYDEAFVEFLEASRRDPGDANNRENMGECMWLSGDLARAEKHLLEALALSPFHVRAAENVAAVYCRELIERRRRARRPIESVLSPSRVFERIDRSDDDVAARAAHFSAVAVAESPHNPFNHEVAGDLALMRGAPEEAVGHYSRAREIDPRRTFSVLGHAEAQSALDRSEEALVLLTELVERGPAPARAYTMAAELLERLGRAEEAIERLRSGLARHVDPPSLTRALYGAYRRLESREAAAARLREITEAAPHDLELARAIADVLADDRQRGHAVAIQRQVIAVSPGEVNAIYELGTLLSQDVMTRAEGEALLERVVELAPAFPMARVRLAWSRCDRDPAGGLALLDPLPDQQDSYVLETRSALLARLGDPGAEDALRLALESWGDPQRGLIGLVDWHLDAMRYERAVELARRIPSFVTRDDLSQRAETEWLSAFRVAGAVREILPALRDRCRDGVPAHLAWEAYWALRSIDRPLAAQAARKYAEARPEKDAARWRIRAAECDAEQGDLAPLSACVAEAGEDAEAWALLSYAHASIERWDEANRFAEQAMAIDATHREALSSMEEACIRRGDLESALAHARRLMDLHPYEHVGPERVGALLAQMLEVDEALTLTHRAVDAAPFCHNAHWSRALALFAAGDLEGAERHARRAIALEEPDGDDAPNGSLMIVYALEGAVDRLERCFARLHAQQPAALFAEMHERLRSTARAIESAR